MQFLSNKYTEDAVVWVSERFSCKKWETLGQGFSGAMSSVTHCANEQAGSHCFADGTHRFSKKMVNNVYSLQDYDIYFMAAFYNTEINLLSLYILIFYVV